MTDIELTPELSLSQVGGKYEPKTFPVRIESLIERSKDPADGPKPVG